MNVLFKPLTDVNVFKRFSVPAPRRLRFKVLSSNSLLVTWKEPKGDVDSYLFLYNSLPGKMIVFIPPVFLLHSWSERGMEWSFHNEWITAVAVVT